MQDHAGDAFDDLNHLGAIRVRDVRGLLDQHRDEHHAPMQAVVRLDELVQRQRHAVGRRCQEDRGSGKPGVASADRGLDQVLFGLTQLAAGTFDQFDAAAPGQHQEGDGAGEQQRKPAALKQLDGIGRKENAIDNEEEAGHGKDQDR